MQEKRRGTCSQRCVSLYSVAVGMVQLSEGNGTYTLASGIQPEVGFDLWRRRWGK